MRVEQPGGPDAVTVDPDQPVYQVEIFDVAPESVGVPGHVPSYDVSEWKLHDVDAPQALAWAADTAAGRPYLVSVASTSIDGESYLIRLHGSNPNRGQPNHECYTPAPDGMIPDERWFIEQAMKRGQ